MWDCGLCCVAMTTGREPAELRAAFELETSCQSVWTIDLLRFLERHSPEYYTASLDVSPAFATLSYYERAFERDRARVLPLLKNEPRAKEQVVATAEVCARLQSEATVAIVLICKNRLLKRPSTDYCGHYLLCVSFEPATGLVKYIDPALGEWQTVVADYLDVARQASGTDLDVVFCTL